MGFPGGSDGKESACSVGDLGLIPGLGRSPGEGHAWRIPMDRGAWWGYSPWDCKEFERLITFWVHKYF